jgi:macrodomain Ter protein organizer (MatP/YcbG family)
MSGGGNLFKVLKKGGGETFKNFTKKNNLNIKFSELWTILSEVRHSITHMESLIEFELINKTKRHGEIFKFLFNSNQISSNLISIELDYQKFERLIKRFSEFTYQVFKVLSIEEELEWESNS